MNAWLPWIMNLGEWLAIVGQLPPAVIDDAVVYGWRLG